MTAESAAKPCLAVVYDLGAGLPLEIARAVRGIADPVFVLADSMHADAARTVFQVLGKVVNLSDPLQTVRALRDFEVSGIVTFSERMIMTTEWLAEKLDLPHHSPSALLALTDKVAQRRCLQDAGLSTVRSRPVATVTDLDLAISEVGLPAVLKPARGEASRDTHMVEASQPSLRSASRVIDNAHETFVFEELLVGRDEGAFGDYVSVECAAVGSTVTPIAITGKLPLLPPFRESGQFWPHRLDAGESDEVARLAAKAVEALGMRAGLSHVEIKLTPTGPAIIEVNARMGGFQADLARRACGLDLIGLASRIALGLPVKVEPVVPDRVFFQYWCPAPTVPAHFIRSVGVPETLRIDGITGYLDLFTENTPIVGGTSTNRLGMLSGHASDHRHMSEILKEALNTLAFDLRVEGQSFRVAAANVASSPSLNLY